MRVRVQAIYERGEWYETDLSEEEIEEIRRDKRESVTFLDKKDFHLNFSK